MGAIKNIAGFLKGRKRWIFIPIIAVLVVMTLLILATENATVLPFVYSLF